MMRGAGATNEKRCCIPGLPRSLLLFLRVGHGGLEVEPLEAERLLEREREQKAHLDAHGGIRQLLDHDLGAAVLAALDIEKAGGGDRRRA